MVCAGRRYSQTQIAGIGTACNVGGYFALFAGLFFDKMKHYNWCAPLPSHHWAEPQQGKGNCISAHKGRTQPGRHAGHFCHLPVSMGGIWSDRGPPWAATTSWLYNVSAAWRMLSSSKLSVTFLCRSGWGPYPPSGSAACCSSAAMPACTSPPRAICRRVALPCLPDAPDESCRAVRLQASRLTSAAAQLKPEVGGRSLQCTITA